MVTQGWNGHLISVSTQLTLEKKILPPILLGFWLTTFWSQVRCYSCNKSTFLLQISASHGTDIFDSLTNEQHKKLAWDLGNKHGCLMHASCIGNLLFFFTDMYTLNNVVSFQLFTPKMISCMQHAPPLPPAHTHTQWLIFLLFLSLYSSNPMTTAAKHFKKKREQKRKKEKHRNKGWLPVSRSVLLIFMQIVAEQRETQNLHKMYERSHEST